jgi:hypothetical protein
MEAQLILSKPVAQQLLSSRIPARFAYTRDFTEPKIVPVWFHWNGEEIVIGRFIKSKTQPSEVATGAPVAVCIDTQDFPYQALTMSGVARVELVRGLVPEYEQACHRYLPHTAPEFLNRIRAHHETMVRIAIHPTNAHLLDMTADEPAD